MYLLKLWKFDLFYLLQIGSHEPGPTWHDWTWATMILIADLSPSFIKNWLLLKFKAPSHALQNDLICCIFLYLVVKSCLGFYQAQNHISEQWLIYYYNNLSKKLILVWFQLSSEIREHVRTCGDLEPMLPKKSKSSWCCMKIFLHLYIGVV